MPLNNKKSKNISAFLKKTYDMLQDSQNQNALQWSPNGVGFIVSNEQILTKTFLPKYFKHSNFSSFVRQLNMYDFHKIKKGNVDNYFYHEKFIKGDIFSISQIKRKPEKKKALKNITHTAKDNLGRYSQESQINAQEAVQNNNKTEATLNILNTIKGKSEKSIIMRENTKLHSKAEPVYYKQCEFQNKNRLSQIDLNRQYLQEDLQNQNDQDSLNASINNDIQSRSFIEQPRQILMPSQNNIYHFINPYQLAHFGLFM